MKARSNARGVFGASAAFLMSTVNCGAEADIEAISDLNIQTQTSAIGNGEVVALSMYEHSNFEGDIVPVSISPDNTPKAVFHHWDSDKHPKRSFVLAPWCGAAFAKDEDAYWKNDYRSYPAKATSQYNAYPSHLKNNGFVDVFCLASSDQRTSAIAFNATDSKLESLVFYGDSSTTDVPSSWTKGGIEILQLDGVSYPDTYAYLYNDTSSEPIFAMLSERTVVNRILDDDVSDQVTSVQFQPSENGCQPTNTCWTSTNCTGRYSLMSNGQLAQTIQDCANSQAGVSWCPENRVCVNLAIDSGP